MYLCANIARRKQWRPEWVYTVRYDPDGWKLESRYLHDGVVNSSMRDTWWHREQAEEYAVIKAPEGYLP